MFTLTTTLKRGSHKLPSEGSCAMEVAALAAGYGWHEVPSADDLPPCFSRVIGAYVIRLNDAMPDDQRQRLMAYVTRMGGTRADHATEKQRAEYLVMHAAKPAAVYALRLAGVDASAVEAATTLADLEKAAARAAAATARAAAATARAARGAAAAAALAALAARGRAAKGAAARATTAAARAARGAAATARAARGALAAGCAFDWTPYLDALDGALAIGPQAEPVDPVELERRLACLKDCGIGS